MSSYKNTCEVIASECLGIKKNEKVVIITDINKRRIGQELFRYIQSKADTVLLEIPSGTRNGEEPPESSLHLLMNADVIIAPTTMSLSHTRAFVNARKNGARVASLPGITEKMFLRSIVLNYKKMKILTEKLEKIFRNKNEVIVQTKKGTDVKFSIKGRKPMALDGICKQKGGFINLPDGEMCIAPLEDSMNGLLVFDLSISPDHKTKWGIGGLLKNELVKVQVSAGKITEISGGKKAKVMKNVIYSADSNASTIAEFAIGTNEKAKITGFILEDEKKLGTIHFAFGSNVSLGGVNQSNLHLDANMGKADIYVDGKIIMKNGKLLI